MPRPTLTPDQIAALPYRPCVGIMILNRDDLVWIGCRRDAANDAEGNGAWWQMPQGGIDPNEDARRAAYREVEEETGMRSLEIIDELPGWLHYDLPAELVGKAWRGKYRGQKQRWFAMRFLGEESEIDITGHNGAKAEFLAWRWAPAGDLKTLIVPFKRDVYATVLQHFAAHAAR